MGSRKTKRLGSAVSLFIVFPLFTPILSSHAFYHRFFLRHGHDSLFHLVVWPSPPLSPASYSSSSTFFFTARKENRVMVCTTYNEDHLVRITPLGSPLLCLIFIDFSFVPLLPAVFLPPVYCWHMCKSLERLYAV